MKQKILVTAVVVLLLLNTAMIVFMWLNRPEKKGPLPQGNVNEFLRTELNLTTEQEAQFEAERRIHFENMRPLHDAAKEKRNELFDQISVPDNNANKIEQLSAELTAAESKKEVLTVTHFRKLRSLLSKEQQDKFDKIFKDVLRMMSGGGPGQRGGPPPRDGEGPRDDHQGPPREFKEDIRDSIQH